MNDGAGNDKPTPLEDFSERLDAVRGDRDPHEVARQGVATAFRGAVRMGIEILVAVVAGIGLGMWLDNITGAKPWFFLGGMTLGFATGFWNLFRTLRNLNTDAQDGIDPPAQ